MRHHHAPPAPPTVHPLRGCQLCHHHVGYADGSAELLCACPLVAGADVRVPCHQARQPGGGCGPNARHQLWPEIELHPTPAARHFEGARA